MNIVTFLHRKRPKSRRKRGGLIALAAGQILSDQEIVPAEEVPLGVGSGEDMVADSVGDMVAAVIRVWEAGLGLGFIVAGAVPSRPLIRKDSA